MKKFRQYRSNQGRDPEKMKYSYVVVFIGIVGIIVGISCMLILKQLTLHSQNNQIKWENQAKNLSNKERRNKMNFLYLQHQQNLPGKNTSQCWEHNTIMNLKKQQNNEKRNFQ